MHYADRELTVTEQQDLGALLWNMARWMQQVDSHVLTYDVGNTIESGKEHDLWVVEGCRLREQAERWARLKANYQFPMGVR